MSGWCEKAGAPKAPTSQTDGFGNTTRRPTGLQVVSLVRVAEVRILVTGASGLVGSALTRTGQVEGFDRNSLDITSTVAFERALDEVAPSAVINAAAQAGVDQADREPERTRRVNAPRSAARACWLRWYRSRPITSLDASTMAAATSMCLLSSARAMRER